MMQLAQCDSEDTEEQIFMIQNVPQVDSIIHLSVQLRWRNRLRPCDNITVPTGVKSRNIITSDIHVILTSRYDWVNSLEFDNVDSVTLFVCFPFFIWPVCCLCFDLWILIIPLISLKLLLVHNFIVYKRKFNNWSTCKYMYF